MLVSKLRSGLSSLGIVIWVFSVVVLLAIGEWAQNSILGTIQSLGTNLLTISPGGQSAGNVRATTGNNRNIFTLDHVDLIKTLSGITAVVPQVQSSKQVVYGSANTSVTIYGITPEYEIAKNTSVSEGIFITEQAYKNRDKVAVIGPTVVTNLFGTKNPIGETIRIGNFLFTVVGVTKSKWTTGFGNQDNTIYIPISTALITITGSPYLASILVQVTNSDDMTLVKTEIENKLMIEFGNAKIADANFTVQSQADLLSSVSSITDILKIFLSGVAAISLIVGGIGVMNILLVTVTERTKEIGIRKAIGAKSRDIIEQFLIESIILTVFGGIIGILLSYWAITIINIFVTSISAVITPYHIILALSFSIGVGLFFGIFPAYKAAKMRPIDALRSE